MKLRILTPKIIGEVLAKSIYNANGGLLLREGIILNDKFLNHLKNAGITAVYIADENTDVVLHETLDSQLRIQIIKDVRYEFCQIAKSRYVDDDVIKTIVSTLLSNINLSENAFFPNNIVQMEGDMRLATHAVDVAIMSALVGVSKGYTREKLEHLITGALLHDIGKLVTKEPSKHPEAGYEIARTNGWLPATSTIVIKQHHDLKAPNMHEYSKIVNVCNSFVNIQLSEIMPHEVIQKLPPNLPTDIYKDFARTVYFFPNGVEVILSNGTRGVVISQNKGYPSRPTIATATRDGSGTLSLVDNRSLFVDNVVI